MNSKNRPNYSKSSKSRLFTYKITDPRYYTQNPTRFFKRLQHSKPADFVSLRDKNNSKLKKLAKRFRFFRTDGEKILHQDFELARRFGFRAVHLSGTQIDKIQRLHRAGFFVIFSAHSLREIRKAKRFRADLVTFSPIFPTPHKGSPLGIRKLRKALFVTKRVVALGGILSSKEIHQIRRVGVFGFASIRSFL